MSYVDQVWAREIMDSKGDPTIAGFLMSESGQTPHPQGPNGKDCPEGTSRRRRTGKLLSLAI